MRSVLLRLPLLMLLLAPSANAAIVSHDISWTGDAGYSVEGTFSFDDAGGFGAVIEETELSSFEVTIFTPTGVPLKTYDLTNQDSFFNFNFDVASGTIFQATWPNQGAFSEVGFFIGRFSPPDNFTLSTYVGCTFRPSPSEPVYDDIILISNLTGSCGGTVLDHDGTALTVDPEPSPVPSLSPFGITLLLSLLGGVGKRALPGFVWVG